MRPSVKDVAREAAVSIATVSRALNNPEKVAEDTTMRVLAAIKKLEFRPNQVGRTLREGKSRTVGVIVPTLSNTVFSQCLQGIERAAKELDYAVMFTSTEYHPEDEIGATELLLRHRVDGLILTVANASSSHTLDRLDREHIPYVLVYNQPGTNDRISVSVDNRAAARDAVQHLIGLGHRHIRMLTGRFAASDRAKLRYRGYCDALCAYGLAVHPAIENPLHTATATQYLEPFLAKSSGPTALFCSNDLLALTAIHDIRRLGLRVPEDVSVIGFDGIEVGQLITPSLATVVQPSEGIGAAALRSVVRRLKGGEVFASEILAHSIRPGGSTIRMAGTGKAVRSTH